VTEIDGVTQQNAALVQESAAAAASLEEQVLYLTQSVSAFRLASAYAHNRHYQSLTRPDTVKQYPAFLFTFAG